MSSKGANRFRSDGSLRRNEVVAKKQVVRQMIDRVPDELSRTRRPHQRTLMASNTCATHGIA